MEKRFFRVYPFVMAVAACAAAAFLLAAVETLLSPAFNICLTIFIYYNRMALSDPDDGNNCPVGSFFAV
jgi:hypothetical protein